MPGVPAEPVGAVAVTGLSAEPVPAEPVTTAVAASVEDLQAQLREAMVAGSARTALAVTIPLGRQCNSSFKFLAGQMGLFQST